MRFGERPRPVVHTRAFLSGNPMTSTSRSWFVLCLTTGALCACQGDEPAGERLEGTGVYTFEGYAPLADKPIPVHYHVPADTRELSSIVIVMHGNTRNADEYRDAWIAKADEYGLIIAAPEFRDLFYPGTSAYHLGNVFENGEAPRPTEENDPALWTYTVIDQIFDDVAERTQNRSVLYHLFGHSAGAQFVHRLVQFVPDAQYGYAIAANAGWYTLPDPDEAFPYGLGLTSRAIDPPDYFARNLLIHAGSADTNSGAAGLRHTPEAERQGSHRFARAQYFVDESRDLASQRGQPFAWSLEVAQGVGHDHVGMSLRAADWLADQLSL